ncbi:MAG: hypothetical protein JMDDDDMK_01206 [Acidobacteria bacterium]|nr:hypothetical protein [Acidobacteriota bacterium]
MAEVTTLNPHPIPLRGAVRAETIAAEIKRQLGDQLISVIYRDRIRAMRTRSYPLNAPVKKADIEIMHTLLGIELKIGKRRLLCPDLAMARYLSVFARLGVAEVAAPYDITQVSRLADELESSWYRMLMLVEHLAVEQSERFRNKVRAALIADERNGIIEAGAGPAIPQFNQNTKQRKAKF